jgi:hypothetical protein
MNFQRHKKSHYDYHPLPREEGEPDETETMKLLPENPREKLSKLFEDGTLKLGDLDHKSIMTLHQLTEPLQLKVIDYLQTERLFLANSRSKAGFLVSACDRAKKGELDARGFGALDPWRSALISECTPKIQLHLIPEAQWLTGQASFEVSIPIETVDGSKLFVFDLRDRISVHKDAVYESLKDVTYTRSRLKLFHPLYGSLRDDRTLAFYNISSRDTLSISVKRRAGRKVVKNG